MPGNSVPGGPPRFGCVFKGLCSSGFRPCANAMNSSDPDPDGERRVTEAAPSRAEEPPTDSAGRELSGKRCLLRRFLSRREEE